MIESESVEVENFLVGLGCPSQGRIQDAVKGVIIKTKKMYVIKIIPVNIYVINF